MLRLEILLEYGGIYLDLDVMLLAPLGPLLDRELVMAREGVAGSIGLGNALVLTQPNSTFLRAW